MYKKRLPLSTILLSLLTLFYIDVTHAEVNYKITELSENQKKISITIGLQNEELLYADSLRLEVDHPALQIADITIPHQAVPVYDPASRETKRVYETTISVLVNIARKTSTVSIDETYIHVTYTTNKQPFPVEKLIPLSFKISAQDNTQESFTQKTKPSAQIQYTEKMKAESLSQYISGLLKTSDSLVLQLLLALLLGILLSLTPCVYPMIPITVGILHGYGTKSFFGNAIRSILYSMGIATTYAMFGLLASCTGPLCGYLLAEPIFIYILVGFLAYMAGSMLGLYELYIPRFMQAPQQTLRAHSLWSVFLFGVVSGGIASPCVSPGLALILSVVATVGNKLLGFLFLFLFGVGLSMPLLIVGTFSSSLNLLPRAGQWMVEIKKVFGFLLLGLCIYYLTNALPWNIILIITACTVAGSGILYLSWAQKMFNKKWKKAYNLIGTCLLAGSVLLFINAAQETFYPYEPKEHAAWLKEFDNALTTAQQHNKLLFVDVWAQFCSICIAINNSLLADELVLKAFEQHYVLLKVDGTSSRSEPYATLQQRYSITGFPTFLIINPYTNEVIKRWDSKIYAMPKERFIEKIKGFAAEFKKQ